MMSTLSTMLALALSFTGVERKPFVIPTDADDEPDPKHEEREEGEEGEERGAQVEEPSAPALLFSAAGPGSGVFTVGGGLRIAYVYIPIPLLEIAFVSGVSDRFALEGRFATLGVLSSVELGGRMHFGDERLATSFHLGALAIFGRLESFYDREAIKPGVSVSGGSRNLQVSAGIDVPIFLHGGDTGELVSFFSPATSHDYRHSFERITTVRPRLALEMPSESSSWYLQLEAYFLSDESPTDPELLVLPVLSVGFST